MRASRFIFVAVLLLGAVLAAPAGEILDRIVATVNGHIILQSDWEDELRYEAFLGGKPLVQLTPADRQAALDRLVDQELLKEQIRLSGSSSAPSPADIATEIAKLRKQSLEGGDDQAWTEMLARFGLTPDDLQRRVASQIAITRLIDDRLRPTIQVDSDSIAAYYQQTFLPQLKQSGGAELSLADATPQIRQLLTEQKLNQALNDWVQALRGSGVIHLETGGPRQ